MRIKFEIEIGKANHEDKSIPLLCNDHAARKNNPFIIIKFLTTSGK